jgi:hypothetical protein
MNDTSKQVLGHMVSILAIMSVSIAVDMFAIDKNPEFLTTEAPYFMVIVVGEVIGMSWYATTFSVSPTGVSIATDPQKGP